MEKFTGNNPNNISSIYGIVAVGKAKVPTSSDMVYRSVASEEALTDLFTSGEVRSRAAAQGYDSHRGQQVYWTRGEEGKHHGLNDDFSLIEAPHSIAAERAVKSHEVTGIYRINESGEVKNKLEELRKKLGIEKKEVLD